MMENTACNTKLVIGILKYMIFREGRMPLIELRKHVGYKLFNLSHGKSCCMKG